MQQDEATWFKQTFDQLVANIEAAVKGKTNVVRLALTCLLTGGHLLLDDVPGTGKTMLARSLAGTVHGRHSRVQFTPDLLPSDITGSSTYDPRSNTFEFHRGAIFANIVLADEVNRASPKTQAALLEVMEEGHVTVDGVPHDVGLPFMVIATMNPVELAGTYPLPEAQLDRFLIRTSLGYPDHQTTIRLLADAKTIDRASYVRPLITPDAIIEMSDLAADVHVDPALLDYVSRLAEESRRIDETELGISVRGCLALVRAAKTWAASQGRASVVPDDIKQLALPVLGHRIMLTADARFSDSVTQATVVGRLLTEVLPPTERGAA